VNEFASFSGNAITLVRYLPGPIERVWAYLTESKLLAQWFSAAEVGDRVGADVRIELGANGRITAYEPPRLLEYTWNEPVKASCGPIFDALVRWELAEEGDRVKLTLTHSRLPDNELLAHGAGWHTFLERMDASLDGHDPAPIEPRYTQLKSEYAKLLGV